MTNPICHTQGHFTHIKFPQLDLFFSYGEPIAFRFHIYPIVAIENKWGATTGKHINMACREYGYTKHTQTVSNNTFHDLLTKAIALNGNWREDSFEFEALRVEIIRAIAQGR